MDDVTRLRVTSQLIRDEGRRNKMYLDSMGAWTIGIGHNLRDRPISDRAVDVILSDDLVETEAELVASLPWVTSLSPPRLGVLLNMSYNLGVPGLLQFHRMLEAMQRLRWEQAADEMRDSKWASQVGERAVRLERQMIEDRWQ